MIELTDTHCHIHSVGGFADEGSGPNPWAKLHARTDEQIIGDAQAAGVTRMLCVGCDLEDSQQAIEFVKSREKLWATVGIHPHETNRYAHDSAALAQFAALATQPKVVAIGECGLDYFYEHSDPEAQKQLLAFQIELALQHGLPLIFHVREAFDDFWPIFKRYQSADKPIRGVLHSFTDTQANLEKALGYGLFIGVNGIATFAKKPEQQTVYRTVPLSNLLLETDAPFLTPVPYRGTICEPRHVRTIAEFLAEQRGEDVAEIATVTTHNAQQLFGIA